MPIKKEEDMSALKAKLNEAKAHIYELEKKFEHKIQEHPMQSVLISFGVGLVSGAIMLALVKKR